MIKLTNLCKSFKDVKIYENVNYTFNKNKLTCIYGPSGSGKTTLLNLIAGFDSDYSGDIAVNEINLSKLNKDELCKYRFDNIGFVFQDYNLLKGYSALDNVLMGINLNNYISDEEKVEKAKDLLTRLELKEYINKDINTLSGGQKQRVAIARALINNPSIILADEPTGALDEESKHIIMKILKEISKDRTVVIITHDDEVLSYADETVEFVDFNLKIKRNSIINELINIKDSKSINNKDANIVASKDISNEQSKDNYNQKLKMKVVTKLSSKNFKIHKFKYLVASLIIAIGTSAFVSTLSFKNITNNLINDFKESNFFYNIGQINLKQSSEEAENLLNKLEKENRIEDIYYQYLLKDLRIKYNDNLVEINTKSPTIMNKESIAYGNMPKKNKNEIAIPENIASKLTGDIKSLIGKEIEFEYKDKYKNYQVINLTVSGITNSIAQDFILSSDVEQDIYENSNLDKDKNLFVAFNIINFEEIAQIDKELKEKGATTFTRSEDVESFQNSFTSLLNLYTAVSYFVLVVGIVISSIILIKIASKRYQEVGLLASLGYSSSNTRKILFTESLYFGGTSTIISFALLLALNSVYKIQFGYDLGLNINSFLIMSLLNITLTIGMSYVINEKLIKTEPAKALRM